MHILIADARPSTRGAMRALLEHDPRCQSVSEAADAQSVLSLLGQGPDLLLLDWGLPGLPAAAIVARARELRPGLVIVALGHHAATRPVSLAAGADAFIDTLAPPEHLVDLLHDLCPAL